MSDATPRPVIRTADQVASHEVDRSHGASIQILIGPEDEAPRFFTRRFRLAPGGRIPCHRHATIEHEQYVLAGEMVLSLDEVERTVRAGDAIYIPEKVAHWYENRGSEDCVFLCMVPRTAQYETEWLVD